MGRRELTQKKKLGRSHKSKCVGLSEKREVAQQSVSHQDLESGTGPPFL